MMKYIVLVIISAILFFAAAGESPAAKAHKARPPLEITIAPVQSGMTAADIETGGAAVFTITARTSVDIPDAVIRVDLTGGAALVSGDTSWKGPLVKGEDRVLKITVRAPLKGEGAIKARISTADAQGPGFGAEARFDLGREGRSKAVPKGQIKKDSKGRGVAEYR